MKQLVCRIPITSTGGECPTVLKLRHKYPSHELGLHKPDPAAYQAVEERLGCHGSQILFFDDLRENVYAARQIGWHAKQIDPKMPTHIQIETHLKANDVLT